jgi:hypothetical protein
MGITCIESRPKLYVRVSAILCRVMLRLIGDEVRPLRDRVNVPERVEYACMKTRCVSGTSGGVLCLRDKSALDPARVKGLRGVRERLAKAVECVEGCVLKSTSQLTPRPGLPTLVISTSDIPAEPLLITPVDTNADSMSDAFECVERVSEVREVRLLVSVYSPPSRQQATPGGVVSVQVAVTVEVEVEVEVGVEVEVEVEVESVPDPDSVTATVRVGKGEVISRKVTTQLAAPKVDSLRAIVTSPSPISNSAAASTWDDAVAGMETDTSLSVSTEEISSQLSTSSIVPTVVITVEVVAAWLLAQVGGVGMEIVRVAVSVESSSGSYSASLNDASNVYTVEVVVSVTEASETRGRALRAEAREVAALDVAMVMGVVSEFSREATNEEEASNPPLQVIVTVCTSIPVPFTTSTTLTTGYVPASPDVSTVISGMSPTELSKVM